MSAATGNYVSVHSMQTVAEGIETRQQHTTLRTLRCDLGQGYQFARPLEAPAVSGFFARAGRGAADTEPSPDGSHRLSVATTAT